MPEILLEMKNVTMEFPGVVALSDVDFSLTKGEVHSIIGENGAGKSTLIKILSGVYTPTQGKISIEGKEVFFNNPMDARKNGLSTIYQELNLVPALSIAENIFLNNLPLNKFGVVKWEQLYTQTKEVLKEIGLKLDPKTKISSLKVANQQLIEIAKSLTLNSKIIIMDEPTSALSDEEISTLFTIIGNLKKKNISCIFISHKINEVLKISDTITVLRDGLNVGTIDGKEANQDKLVHMMVGRELKNLFPKSSAIIGEVIFEVKNLVSRNLGIKNVSFNLRRGEILGIFGLVGSKRTELARSIFGAEKIDSGEIYMEGKLIKNKNTEYMAAAGVGFIPEDRKQSGIFPVLSVAKNISISSLNKISKGNVIRKNFENLIVTEIVKKMDVRTPNIERKIIYLSGGNQQKAIISRWLIRDDLKILIMDEPARGIDVGAKSEIHRIISDLAVLGIGIIMISSELPEILGMSDRIVVMREGEISGEFNRDVASQENLLKAAIHL
jgi:ABC-type sugar transport system ATPase subunit